MKLRAFTNDVFVVAAFDAQNASDHLACETGWPDEYWLMKGAAPWYEAGPTDRFFDSELRKTPTIREMLAECDGPCVMRRLD